MRGLFVTGTDTGVGKTAVTCVLARQWAREERRYIVRKPVSTGGVEDALALSRASGQPVAEVTPCWFREPAAPSVAAAAEGRVVPWEEMIQSCTPRGEEAVLVEGVGGLLCPLTDTHTVADLAVHLGLPVLIVARRSLGTLNHTLMTWEAAQRRGLNTLGVVISETEPVSGLAARTAPDELRRRKIPVLAVLPHGSDELSPWVDWWSLTCCAIK
jgi:dethiobiotin synthetase